MSTMARPYIARITEVNPHLRRIHVVGEIHPGELADRGYVERSGEHVLDLRRPDEPGHDADDLVHEFQALSDLGYGFAEGDEWSPAELFRKYSGRGRLRGGK